MNLAQIGALAGFTRAAVGGGDFTDKYQAVLDKGTALTYSLPSTIQQELENEVFFDLIDAGLIDKALLGLMFRTDGDSDYATLNWVDPDNYKATKVNTPVFTNLEGFKSDGLSSYLNSNFPISALTQNSVSFAARGFVDSAVNNRTIFGCADGGGTGSENITLNPRDDTGPGGGGNKMYGQAFRANLIDLQQPVTDAIRRLILARGNNTDISWSADGAGFTDVAAAVNVFEDTSRTIGILALITSSGATFYNVGGISYFWIFNGKLSDVEAADFDAAMVKYLS